jgi:hypothetical protein
VFAPLCLPEAIDENKQVNDLSELDASNWCVWQSLILHASFVHTSRQFPAKDAAPQCVPDRSIEECVKNLRSKRCTATLAQINDCVATLTLFRPNGVWSYWVRHGCAPLLANPSCAGVVVQPLLDDDTLSAQEKCMPRD